MVLGVGALVGLVPRAANALRLATTVTQVNQLAAAAELERISRLLDDGWRAMKWGEVWRWLHRMKGVIGSVKASRVPALQKWPHGG